MKQYDGRNRLSNFWTPTQAQPAVAKEDAHDLLLRAGFLRQAHSGIFHLLPLGLRVQNKIEQLIDKHMVSLGASKVALSSLTSEDLWQRSGRLDKGRGSEFFRLQDRKDGRYLLAPTHEEEITSIVGDAVHSYKDLPLRLYQVSRKYRDEARPRQGLLRGREFVMKDLYTFDINEDAARKTYEQVRKSYSAFLDELNLPYLVANADSGSMGGSLSHEYHFASTHGEDTIVQCDSCGYSTNEELYVGKYNAAGEGSNYNKAHSLVTWMGLTKDRRRRVFVYYPRYDPNVMANDDLNLHAVKAIFPDVDLSISDLSAEIAKIPASEAIDLRDCLSVRDPRLEYEPDEPASDYTTIDFLSGTRFVPPHVNGNPITFTKAQTGDTCPQCQDGHLGLHQAIEIGHTFHLGTRYSVPLEANVMDSSGKVTAISMGCHGIGVSRLIGAVASLLADDQGLNWPVAVAPFTAVIVPTQTISFKDMGAVYDRLAHVNAETQNGSHVAVDVALDDRERPLGWKLKDADLVGYPIIIVVGRGWADGQKVEIQCRRLGIKQDVHVDDLADAVELMCLQLTARVIV